MNGVRSSKAGAGTRAAKQIAKRLDGIPHEVYVEPFLGRGDIFRAKQPSTKEVLNDLDCRRVTETRQKTCGTNKSNPKCVRLTKQASVSCGKDWKRFLRYDSPKTLFMLDPPWERVATANMNYHQKGIISASEVVGRASRLKGAVAIYYKNTPETRRVLCKKPFRCSKIKGNILGRQYTQLLAVKKPKHH